MNQNLNNETEKNLVSYCLWTLIPKKNFAFTLAEVLITLGIIGAVAAMTIPNLIANNRAKVFRSKYLKAYSVISQMMKLIEADDIEMDNTTRQNLTKYLSGATKRDGGELQNRDTLSNDPFYYFNSKKYKTYDGKADARQTMFDDTQYALPDGMLLVLEWYDIHYPDGSHHWISVDINGYNNGPNRWGVDLFTFQILDGKILAIGDNGSAFTDMDIYCNSKTTTNDLNGIACAHLAKSDTEYFKKAVKLK